MLAIPHGLIGIPNGFRRIPQGSSCIEKKGIMRALGLPRVHKKLTIGALVLSRNAIFFTSCLSLPSFSNLLGTRAKSNYQFPFRLLLDIGIPEDIQGIPIVHFFEYLGIPWGSSVTSWHSAQGVMDQIHRFMTGQPNDLRCQKLPAAVK